MMKINNLKIYNKNINTKIVALSLVGASIIGLSGCHNKNTNNNIEINNSPSIVDIIECLAEKRGLTLTDENMKEVIIKDNGTLTNIDNLYKKYIEANKKGKKNNANEALYYMGIISLKSLISEIYEIPFDKIEEINTDIVPTSKLNKNNNNIYEYPIEFKYNNALYTLLPQDKLSRELVYCINKAKNNHLDYNSDYYNIYDAYNIIRASLLLTGDKKDIKTLKEVDKNYYLGNLTLYYNYDKLDQYYDYFTLSAEDITEQTYSKTKKLS